MGVRRSGLGENIGSAWILYRGGSAGKILFALFLAEFKGFYVFQVLLIHVWQFLGRNKCQICANSTKRFEKKERNLTDLKYYIPLPLEWRGEKWLLIFFGRAKYFCKEDNFSLWCHLYFSDCWWLRYGHFLIPNQDKLKGKAQIWEFGTRQIYSFSNPWKD